MSGFECSTFLWKDRQRKNFIELTGHNRHFSQDCERVKDLGIATQREAIPWPFVDLGNGRYDWTETDRAADSLAACNITPIWDLFHYGLPDNCNPLDDDCRKRFVDYAVAAANRVIPRDDATPFFTPVNEITFFSGACTDMEWMYPFAKGKYPEMKRALCRMAIEAAKAIRREHPDARFVNVDPLIYEVPPPDRPDLADEAHEKTYVEAFEAWDILGGLKEPELGGSMEVLDIVGVNVYNFCQSQLNADQSRTVLGPQDPRRKPLSEMLKTAWDRYHRPLIIGETSGWQDHRAEWLKMTMQECLKAIDEGIDLQGVCLYPVVDIPDWNTGEWAKIGIFDIEDKQSCERIPVQDYIDELRRWQKILDQPENVEHDHGLVELDEVWRLAKQHARKVSLL